MIYVVHHAVTLVVAAAAAWALSRGRWQPRSPRLALLLWHATAVSAVTGTIGLLLSVGLEPYGLGIAPALGALAAGEAAPPSGARAAAVSAGLLLAAAAVGVQAHSPWQPRRGARQRRPPRGPRAGGPSRPPRPGAGRGPRRSRGDSRAGGARRRRSAVRSGGRSPSPHSPWPPPRRASTSYPSEGSSIL